MDYEIGSIADLISGNRTPNRPKVLTKPLTPVKQPPIINITPQDDFRTKPKTPKIAFTPEVAPKTPSRLRDAERSHLESPKSVPPKKRKSKLFNNFQFLSQIPDYSSGSDNGRPQEEDEDDSGNEFTVDQQKKKKIDKKNAKMVVKEYYEGRNEQGNETEKKSKKRNSEEVSNNEDSTVKSKKKNKKLKVEMETEVKENDSKDSKSLKKQKRVRDNVESDVVNEPSSVKPCDDITDKKKKKKNKLKNLTESKVSVNGTDDSFEETENIQSMSNVDDVPEEELPPQESDDENLTEHQKSAKRRVKEQIQRNEKFDDEELARTLFVGNIPVEILKKNYEKILRNKFTPYGLIQSVRIRNIPIVDFKTRPKVALIEKKFHPERTTVIAYIKYAKAAAVEKALVENNSLIENNHIRVDRCQKGKPAVDKRKTLFLGNLPFSVEEETIRNIFEKCGMISSIRVVRDKKTQIGKGIGFVNFEKTDGVEIALTMDEEDLQINGKTIRVKRYTTNINETDRNDSRNFRENKVVGKRYQKFNQPPPREQQTYGKKRDSQGNKIRKRDLAGGDFQQRRKKDNNFVQNTEHTSSTSKFKSHMDHSESYSSNAPAYHGDTGSTENRNDGYKSRKDKGNLDFKGLIAAKKKKMKLSKGVLQKKKISKILLQHQKIPK